MESNLKELFLNHQGKISDKWSFYLSKWDEIFSPYKDHNTNLLEIGIQNGGSLEIWAKYFSKARHIIGCDIDDACQKLEYDDPRISVFIGDINSDEIEHRILEITSELDIIIDDGSHNSIDTIRAFARYFNHVSDNGIYVIEDVHTSYWSEFEGGLNHPYSAIAFLKRLADVTNFEHWRNGQQRVNYLSEFDEKYDLKLNESDLCRIHSVKFLNSLCIIQKGLPEQNRLGDRVVVGNKEQVTENWKNLNGTSIHDKATSIIDDSHLDVFSLLKQTEQQNINLENYCQQINTYKTLADEWETTNKSLTTDLAERDQSIQQLTTDLAERDQSIQQLTTDLAEREQEVLFYVLSKSWAITRPLRKIVKALKGNKGA